MTQRKLAERIVEQAEKTDWCVCCLCSEFIDGQECQHFEGDSEDKKRCIEGIRQWLMVQNKSREAQ